MTDTWTWITERGARATVVPVALHTDDPDPWYPEQPGDRPPQAYEITVGRAEPFTEVVYPTEPWSPADAIADRLRALGWQDTTRQPEPELCEHGLSADLCADPITHYPPEM